MRKLHYKLIVLAALSGIIISCSKQEYSVPVNNNSNTNLLKAIPANPGNKVAYYAFDATPSGQGKLRLTEFTDNANIVVVFEGTILVREFGKYFGPNSSNSSNSIYCAAIYSGVLAITLVS